MDTDFLSFFWTFLAQVREMKSAYCICATLSADNCTGNDGEAGGCDNVRIVLSGNNLPTISYFRLASNNQREPAFAELAIEVQDIVTLNTKDMARSRILNCTDKVIGDLHHRAPRHFHHNLPV
jgi:hypothetical protein